MDIKRVGTEASAMGPAEWLTGTVRITAQTVAGKSSCSSAVKIETNRFSGPILLLSRKSFSMSTSPCWRQLANEPYGSMDTNRHFVPNLGSMRDSAIFRFS
jgi:hypothetical protein